jgi:long-chain acyl-CoA synthetase
MESIVSGESDKNDDIIVTATIFPNFEAVSGQLGENPDKSEVQKLIEGEVKKVNQQLVTYKHVKKVVLRDQEFEKTTSKKIRRVYK